MNYKIYAFLFVLMCFVGMTSAQVPNAPDEGPLTAETIEPSSLMLETSLDGSTAPESVPLETEPRSRHTHSDSPHNTGDWLNPYAVTNTYTHGVYDYHYNMYDPWWAINVYSGHIYNGVRTTLPVRYTSLNSVWYQPAWYSPSYYYYPITYSHSYWYPYGFWW